MRPGIKDIFLLLFVLSFLPFHGHWNSALVVTANFAHCESTLRNSSHFFTICNIDKRNIVILESRSFPSAILDCCLFFSMHVFTRIKWEFNREKRKSLIFTFPKYNKDITYVCVFITFKFLMKSTIPLINLVTINKCSIEKKYESKTYSSKKSK